MYFLQTFLLNDALQINAVTAEMSPNLTGQTPLTTIGEIIYLIVSWRDVRISELAPGRLITILILKTISCGLPATAWTGVLNIPQNQIVIYYLNTS